MMIKLDKPNMEQKDVINACIDNLGKEPTLSNIKKVKHLLCEKVTCIIIWVKKVN